MAEILKRQSLLRAAVPPATCFAYEMTDFGRHKADRPKSYVAFLPAARF